MRWVVNSQGPTLAGCRAVERSSAVNVLHLIWGFFQALLREPVFQIPPPVEPPLRISPQYDTHTHTLTFHPHTFTYLCTQTLIHTHDPIYSHTDKYKHTRDDIMSSNCQQSAHKQTHLHCNPVNRHDIGTQGHLHYRSKAGVGKIDKKLIIIFFSTKSGYKNNFWRIM